MKKFVEKKLKKTAKKILQRQQPKIVAVTGSVGKTSTKNAIVAVLQQKFSVRGAKKNYNNEIGMPLTIIGAESPGKSKFGWLAVFWKAKKLIWSKCDKYPDWLVLEMGADRKGDISYLANIAPPDVAVVTAVSPAHTQYLGSIGEVADEKSDLVKALDSDGIAVLNGDDLYVRDMEHDNKGRAIFFGFGDEEVRADDISMDFPETGTRPRGIRGVLRHNEETKQFLIEGAVGRHTVYSVLAGAAVGLALDMSLQEVVDGLRDYEVPPGRMKLLEGIKHTLLIDDSYNSSPLAAIAAVETLAEIRPEAGGDRYAVLGDMLELGNMAVESHIIVGKRVAELPIQSLFTVGELGKEIAKAAVEAGMPENRIAQFANAEEAGLFLQQKIKLGDVVLVKGSAKVRTEKIVKEVMAEPLRAEELLVRQGPEWLNK